MTDRPGFTLETFVGENNFVFHADIGLNGDFVFKSDTMGLGAPTADAACYSCYVHKQHRAEPLEAAGTAAEHRQRYDKCVELFNFEPTLVRSFTQRFQTPAEAKNYVETRHPFARPAIQVPEAPARGTPKTPRKRVSSLNKPPHSPVVFSLLDHLCAWLVVLASD
eukprot:m.213225 g.213225  ORF g.213225 m.213225 type:complete len:165 (-) comp15573_c0_seq17:1227-1721(-)